MATRQREKAAARIAQRDTRPFAVAKYVRISPSKVRILLNLVRGKDYSEAEAILEYNNSTAAEEVLNVLRSAGANAENNSGLNKSELYIAEAFADGGPTLKRSQPVSKGRAHAILKRTSHITIKLDVKKA